MATLEEVTDQIAGGCVAVPSAGWDVCEWCRRPSGDFTRCWSCNETRKSVSHPCELVAPISLMAKDTQIYSELKRYKGSSQYRKLASVRVVALLGRFLRDHGDCISERAGTRWDTITHVPSTSGLHRGVHPLARILTMYEPLARQHAELLDRGGGSIGRSAGSDDGFVARPGARDREVLLIDDTWTTGSHAQSAASALTIGGARVVAIVPVGRLIDPKYYEGWWDDQRRRRFDFDACCLDGTFE